MTAAKTTGKAKIAKAVLERKAAKPRKFTVRRAGNALGNMAVRKITAFHGDAGQVIHAMQSGMLANIGPEMANRLGITQDCLFERLRLPKNTLKGRIRKG